MRDSHEADDGDSPGPESQYAAPTLETGEGRRTIKRAVVASAMGNATEWFDYGVYSVAVVYITANFFSGATVWALATFAISFLVRPLGGLIWGPLGDKLGRKAVLAITILMMAGSTAVIGVLPTEHSIGDVDALLAELDRIRERGYAIDDQEQEIGVRCFSMAVPDAPTPTAVSVSGPISRVDEAFGERAVPMLRKAAEAISAELAS